jgi:F-type H+-transporting ATPase subunit O
MAKKPAAPAASSAAPSSTSGSSASASASGSVNVPVKLFGVAGRYATALFSAAAKRGALEAVEADLVAIRTMGEKAKQFLKDPTVSKKSKADVIRSDFAKSAASDLTKNFMVLLAENGRLAHADKIAEAYGSLMSAHRGEVEAVVTTADKLTAAQQKNLTDALQTKIAKGQTLKLLTKVDPSIVGGLIVDLGDKQIDLSIVGRVQRLRTALAQPI